MARDVPDESSVDCYAEDERSEPEASGGEGIISERKEILDPCKSEVRLKIHWIAQHVTNDSASKALEGYGEVEDVARDVWRVPGFEHIKSTTRAVRMSLKSGPPPSPTKACWRHVACCCHRVCAPVPPLSTCRARTKRLCYPKM